MLTLQRQGRITEADDITPLTVCQKCNNRVQCYHRIEVMHCCKFYNSPFKVYEIKFGDIKWLTLCEKCYKNRIKL